jgi:hypothetical protein
MATYTCPALATRIEAFRNDPGLTANRTRQVTFQSVTSVPLVEDEAPYEDVRRL